jgi:DNA repair protein RecN (Recombination protein N)
MLQNELERLENHIKKSSQDRELLSFQSKEIEDGALTPGEDAELRIEKDRRQNSEKLFKATDQAQKFIYSQEGSMVEMLGVWIKELEDVKRFDPGLEKTVETLNSALYALEEASTFLRDYASSIESDPARLEEVDARLDAINKLKRKYGSTIEEILAKKAELDKGLGDISKKGRI